jgi:hypothetical protein
LLRALPLLPLLPPLPSLPPDFSSYTRADAVELLHREKEGVERECEEVAKRLTEELEQAQRAYERNVREIIFDSFYF